MYLDAIVRHDIGMVHRLEDTHFIADLASDIRDQLGILQADLLNRHELARIQVHGGIDISKGAAANKLAELPAHGKVGGS